MYEKCCVWRGIRSKKAHFFIGLVNVGVLAFGMQLYLYDGRQTIVSSSQFGRLYSRFLMFKKENIFQGIKVNTCLLYLILYNIQNIYRAKIHDPHRESPYSTFC